MAGLDFDGDYGRTYNATIRRSIPGYDALLEIGAAALAEAVPAAQTALVVGPGHGTEVPDLLTALPAAHLTLLEPSPQMAAVCAARIRDVGADARCTLLPQALEPGADVAAQRFDAVVCHHVLHLLPPAAQTPLLQTLAGCVAPGGALLLSSYSEDADPGTMETTMAIARTRLQRLGLSGEVLEQFMAGRNLVVFSLDAITLNRALAEAGLEPPLQLLQALANRLWLSRRPPAPGA